MLKDGKRVRFIEWSREGIGQFQGWLSLGGPKLQGEGAADSCSVTVDGLRLGLRTDRHYEKLKDHYGFEEDASVDG